MYLFLDTETTGPVSRNLDERPRLVQVSWLLTDERGSELRSQNFIIRPDGFRIPHSAKRRHRLTTESAQKFGIALGDALLALSKDMSAASYIVAHNVQFDFAVLAAEFRCAGLPPQPLDAATPYCTMVSATRICGLRNGPRGYKWPSLLELHTFLFGCEFEDAHNALADVRACAKCFFELRRRGVDFDSAFEIQNLFDELYDLADRCPWFDTRKFVDDVYAHFLASGSISAKQRGAIVRIRDMLERKCRTEGFPPSGARVEKADGEIAAAAVGPASLGKILANLFNHWRV